MGCGDRHANQVRSGSGRKPSERCFLYCNEADVEDWQVGARRWLSLLAPYRTGPLAAEVEAIESRIEQMSEPSAWPGEWNEGVLEAIRIQADAACVLERAEDAAKQGGAEPPPVPVPPREPAGWLPGTDSVGSLGTAALVGAGAYLLWTLTRD